MEEEREKTTEGRTMCPFCAVWSAYKNSEFATHVRGMKREGLMALRSVLDWCIRKAGGLGRREESNR